MAKSLRIPPYMVNKGLADISKDGLEPETTDSILAANGTDDTIGEDNLVPPAPYPPGNMVGGGAPPSKEMNTMTGGLKTGPGK